MTGIAVLDYGKAPLRRGLSFFAQSIRLGRANVRRTGLRRLLAPVAICTAATPVAAATPPTIELSRVGSWQVDYDDNSCHLLATFGQDEKQIIVNLTRYGPGDDLELRLYGRPFKSAKVEFQGTAQFGSAGNANSKTVLLGKTNDLPMAIFGKVRLDNWVAPSPGAEGPPLAPADEAKDSDLAILAPNRASYRLHFGPIGAAMTVMRACTDDLVKSWGYDPAQILTLMSLPTPNDSSAGWIMPNDYPAGELLDGHSGLIQFRLDIDATGAVRGCHILGQTGGPDFASTTCRNLRARARFAPARDQSGSAIPWFYINTVVWRTY